MKITMTFEDLLDGTVKVTSTPEIGPIMNRIKNRLEVSPAQAMAAQACFVVLWESKRSVARHIDTSIIKPD